MKKFIRVGFVVFLCVLFCSNARYENKNRKDSVVEDRVVNVGVMQGPSGFSAAMLTDVNLSVYPSPNEAVSRLVSGELDMAVLPANMALLLYNKGVQIKSVAVTGEGMLSLIGKTSHSVSPSKYISIPGEGGTPDHMAKLLYSEYEPSYSVSSPAQLAQFLIAGKTELAILPQPFVTMVLDANSSLSVLEDVGDRWTRLTGQEQYPMSILVATKNFVENEPELFNKTVEKFKASVEKVLENSDEVSLKIEELGIMNASVAKKAIPFCNIVFVEKEEAEKMCNSYFSVLYNLDPESIGNAVSDKSFWY